MTDPAPGGAEVGVDVVIAVHNPQRPVDRAVRSVLEGNGEGVRLTLVCHNVAADRVAERLDAGHAQRVRFLEHHDGGVGASGPFNAGVDAGSAEYVAILGSDDFLMPGAVASWYWLARRTGADAVIARLELGTARHVVHTPPTRPLRRRNLDAVKDRLSYRSAPLGLVSREAITRLGLRLDEDVPVGGDVALVTRLWFGANHVAFDRFGPAYVIGEDATDRVTYAARPIASELRFLRRLIRRRWFTGLPLEARRAACVKFLRIHLFGAVHNRPDPATWTKDERADLGATARLVLNAAPGVEAVLSIADRRLLDAIVSDRTDPARLVSLALARRRHGRWDTVLTRDVTRVLEREAPLRMMAASVLTR